MLPHYFFHAVHPHPKMRYLSYHGTNVSVLCWYQSLSCVVSHRITSLKNTVHTNTCSEKWKIKVYSFWVVFVWTVFVSDVIYMYFSDIYTYIHAHSRVSFCDGWFYDDSLLRLSPNRTEHSRLVVHHCRNSSVLSLLIALLALFRCARCFFFFYFSAVLLSWLWFFHPWRPSERQKRRKNQNSWRYVLCWYLLNHGLGLLQQNKKWFDWYFFNYLCNFLYT